MDSITHIVLGMAEGELIAGKKLGKKAMLWGALANSVPDIDVVTSFFLRSDQSLLAHRGITHSILFAVFFSISIAWFFRSKNSKLGFTEWLMLWGCGLFSHILLDSFTNYGTGWFEPFSHARISFNNIFVADPFYTLPLIVTAIALLIKKKYSSGRGTWAAIGLIISILYLGYTFYHKAEVNSIAEKNFTQQNIPVKRFFTTPTPLNNFLWYVIAENDEGYYTGFYSVFDKSDSMNLYFTNPQHEMLNEFADDNRVQNLLRFSQGWYAVSKDSLGVLSFYDLRFGSMGFEGNEGGSVFSYQLKKNAEGEVDATANRMRSFDGAFQKLIKRIGGK